MSEIHRVCDWLMNLEMERSHGGGEEVEEEEEMKGRSMDVYGMSSPDLLRIDDLLDFSNDEIFSSSTSSTVTSSAGSSSFPSENPFNFPSPAYTSPPLLTDFTHDLCVPSDDAAHLEWLSRFVDDSFSDFPAIPLTMTVRPEISFTGKLRSRRSRAKRFVTLVEFVTNQGGLYRNWFGLGLNPVMLL